MNRVGGRFELEKGGYSAPGCVCEVGTWWVSSSEVVLEMENRVGLQSTRDILISLLMD